jgi:hypothetical protein
MCRTKLSVHMQARVAIGANYAKDHGTVHMQAWVAIGANYAKDHGTQESCEVQQDKNSGVKTLGIKNRTPN